MADSGWIAFGSALAGALAGGGASTVGSVIANRRELVRGARIRLYEDLLDEFKYARQSLYVLPSEFRDGPRPPLVDDVLASMHRAAVIAGKRDRELVAAVAVAWQARREAEAREYERADRLRDKHKAENPGQPAPPIALDYSAENRAVDESIEKLTAHLERKIR